MLPAWAKPVLDNPARPASWDFRFGSEDDLCPQVSAGAASGAENRVALRARRMFFFKVVSSAPGNFKRLVNESGGGQTLKSCMAITAHSPLYADVSSKKEVILEADAADFCPHVSRSDWSPPPLLALGQV